MRHIGKPMNPHPGQELRKLRESKGISLEKAAADTRLRAGLLQELEESADVNILPDVYRKLSLRMYARYLGLDFEVTRRATQTREGVRIMPVGKFVRRMGRPLKSSRLDTAQRNRLLSVAKTASAAVVVVLAIGLWSLNAKLSRLNLDDRPSTGRHVAQAAPQAVPQSTDAPSQLQIHAVLPRENVVLEDPVTLTLAPGPQTQHAEAGF
ncbi:MAG: hypothetical protein FGM15_02400 [Chthoniobacterales bacterium]|nr:hypothetical protein [Chthoniobacterales bacterium]